MNGRQFKSAFVTPLSLPAAAERPPARVSVDVGDFGHSAVRPPRHKRAVDLPICPGSFSDAAVRPPGHFHAVFLPVNVGSFRYGG